MKPCSHHKKNIAALAAHALKEPEAKAVRAHLKKCMSCREYAGQLARVCQQMEQAAQEIPLVECSETFHQRLMGKIRAQADRPAAMSIGRMLRDWSWGWSGGLAVLAALVICFAVIQHKGPGRVASAPKPMAGAALGVGSERAGETVGRASEPTYSNYRMAANDSWEALEALLTEQASGHSTPAKTFTASMVAKNFSDLAD